MRHRFRKALAVWLGTGCAAIAAAGRYTWYVSGGTNYLAFQGAQSASFNLVFETVD